MLGKWFGFERQEVYEEALDLFDRGDVEEATKAFEACFSEDDSDTLVTFYLGRCYEILASNYLAEEEFAVAAANAENALSLNPKFPDLHVIAAKAFLGLGRKVLAKHHLMKALEMNPGYVEATELLVSLSEGPNPQVSDPVRAEEAPAKPEVGYAEHLMTIGEDCARKGLFVEALAVYEKASSLAPSYPDVYCRIADTHMKLGEFDLAEFHLNQCLALNGSYVEALLSLSEIRILNGQKEAGQQLSQQAFKIDSQRSKRFYGRSFYVS